MYNSKPEKFVPNFQNNEGYGVRNILPYDLVNTQEKDDNKYKFKYINIYIIRYIMYYYLFLIFIMCIKNRF